MPPPSKKLGLWMATALVIGNILGAGILMVPASLAPYGWNALPGWGLTLVGTLCLAWVFAQLARRLPDAGGANGFMILGVGEGTAFLGSWGYFVSNFPSIAAIALTGISYLARLLPSVGQTRGATTALALGLIWLLTWVNLRGVRSGGAVQVVTTIVKLLPFVAVIGLAIWRLVGSRGAVLAPILPGSFSFGGTAAVGAFTLSTMLGFESATIAGNSVEHSERNVPRATMIGTIVSAAACIIVTCAIVLMLPAAQVTASNAPIADFIEVSWGRVAGAFVAVCAVVSCFGAVNGWLLVAGQTGAAMADAGSLSPWFGKRNSNGVPANSILLTAVSASLLTLLATTKAGVGAFNFAVLLVTATNIPIYLCCAAAALKLMADGRLPRSPVLTACAMVGVIFSVWAFYGTGLEALAWGAGLIAAGWPIYVMMRRRHAARAARMPAIAAAAAERAAPSEL